ncbi:MAG TPA: TolC family protein [Tepidisphaeraceae bacterium]|nr:TolC family protein [Tepidisphaeraceae bacterium]
MYSSPFFQRTVTLLSLALLLSGCTIEGPDKSFQQVQSLTQERIGTKVYWNRNSEQDAQARAATERALSQPLTCDAAVTIALLNNHRLQATFEDLGISQADFVQAGLLDNPVFNLSIRFPNNRPAKTYLDIAAAENFLNIFLIPARKKIATAQRDEAIAHVTNEVLSLAGDTRVAFYDAQAAQQMVSLRQSISDAANAGLDAATRLRQAGNTTDLDYYTQRAQAGRAKIDLANARAEAEDAREKLNAMMGLWGPKRQWKIAGRLPDAPTDEIDADGLESLAVQQRLDLAAAKKEVLVQSRKYGLTVDTRFFAQADAGVEGERETDGQWRIGPTISVPIPLFDQGQAAIARAHAELRQSQERYLALAVEIRAQVRAARAHMLNARIAAQFYHDEILPTQQKVIDQTQLRYNGMLVGVFQLLQAKRDEIDAAAQYVEELRTYWRSRAELERAIGGPLPVEHSKSSATRPTSMPAMQDHRHGVQP